MLSPFLDTHLEPKAGFFPAVGRIASHRIEQGSAFVAVTALHLGIAQAATSR
ncbi:MAG: hypothetical protein ABI970_10860 [Chloroflexota bacterium]|nr:hypothetical protein [Anaerolineae bacterium]